MLRMPNWCSIEISGFTKALAIKYFNGEGKFDFNKVIPMPKSLDIISGSITDEAIAVYTYRTTGKCDRWLFDYVYRKCGTAEELYVAKTVAELESTYKQYRTQALSRDVSQYQDASMRNVYEKYKTLRALGKQYVENKQKYGYTTWYDWCVNNWGTKWNACDTVYDAKNKLLQFNTAWSVPKPIFVEIARENPNAKLEIVYQLEEEDIDVEHVCYVENGCYYDG